MAAVTERAFFATPLAGAGGRLIAAPLQFLTTGEDNLRIVSVNSLVGVRIKLQGLRVDERGIHLPSSWDHTPNSDRTTASSDFPLGVGALLNLTVFATGATPQPGQTFVIVQLIRGLGTAAIVLGTLLQGVVTSTQGIGWPGSPIVSSTDGEPYVRLISGTTPGAGAEINETVPTGARWELLALTSILTTSAVAAARVPRVSIFDGFRETFTIAQPGSQPASVAARHTWGQGISDLADSSGLTFQTALPVSMRLRGGWVIRTHTTGIQFGDQYSVVAYTVREWLEVL